MSDCTRNSPDQLVPLALLRDTLLAEKEVAARTGISAETLRKWRPRGIGPQFTRIGSAIRYRADHLLAYIEANTVPCGGSAA